MYFNSINMKRVDVKTSTPIVITKKNKGRNHARKSY